MGFLKITGSRKDYNTKDNKEQSLLLFLLQTFFFLPYLLHNSMSKELFGEASKCRNKKKEARSKKENWTEMEFKEFEPQFKGSVREKWKGV